MAVHLLTGPGGSGVSTAAAALAVGLAASGDEVVLGYVADDGSHERLVPAGPPATIDLGAPGRWGEGDAALAALVSACGGDGDVAEEWRRLPGAEVLATLAALGRAVTVADDVVVDLGDLRAAARIIGAVPRLAWSLRRLLGLQRELDSLAGPPAAHLVGAALDDVEAAAEILTEATTRLHLVVPDDAPGVAKLRRLVPPMLLTGLAPGLAIMRGSRRGDERSTPDTPAWAPFVPVHPGPPPLGSDGRFASDPAAWSDPILDAMRAGALPAGGGPRVRRIDGVLTWRLPLPWVSAGDLDVEQRGEDIVVRVHGATYLLPPPAVVRRSTIAAARVDGATLTLEAAFVEEEAWRVRGR